MDHAPAVRLNTVSDVSSRLCLSRSTIESMIRDGRLEAIRFGRAVRITEDSVAQLVAASKADHDS